MKLFTLLVLIPCGVALCVAWSWMITLGIVHLHVLDAVHPVGYGVLVGPAFLFTYVSVVGYALKELIN